jgi:mRNA-degrading endonuclease toxin of MazEF toxin-antitoxin module
MKALRGEVVLVDYPYAAGVGAKVRPAVVIQNDHDNQPRSPEQPTVHSRRLRH